MKLRRLWVPVAVVALALAASAAVPVLRGLGGGHGDVPTGLVERGAFARRIHAEGNLKAADATLLGPPPEMRRPLKIAWMAPEGTRVRAGEVVIRFDATDLEDELRQGRHDAAATDAKVAAQTVRNDGARHNLERDAEVAGLELDHAQSFQRKDPLIFSRREIIEAEIDQSLAQEKKDHAEQTSGVHDELARTELDLLAIERRKAELKISQAGDALKALEVRAPHDGIFVLNKVWGRKPEIGQMVWGGNSVAEIPKPEVMEALVYVLEVDAGGLEVGLPATVTIEAHPDQVHAAKVRQVAALAQRRDPQVPVQYFTVTLALEHTDPATMKPGHRVAAELVLDERADALSVPRQAVQDRDGKKVVWVRRGEGFEPVEVRLGPAALGRIVVEEGLSGGERIALRDPTRRHDEPQEGDGGGESSPIQ